MSHSIENNITVWGIKMVQVSESDNPLNISIGGNRNVGCPP